MADPPAASRRLLGDNPSLCAVQQNPQYYNAQLANLTLPSHYQGPCQHGGALSTVAAPAPAPGEPPHVLPAQAPADISHSSHMHHTGFPLAKLAPLAIQLAG